MSVTFNPSCTDEQYNQLSPLQIDQLSLNLNNSNASKLLKTLSFELDPNGAHLCGAAEITELMVRIRCARNQLSLASTMALKLYRSGAECDSWAALDELLGTTPEYLRAKLDELMEVCELSLKLGMREMNWA